MNEQEFIEQENYELNGEYAESAIENEYFDLYSEESEDDIFEDNDFYFSEEESEMEERVRVRDKRNRPLRRPIRKPRKGGIRGFRPRGFPRINYGRSKPIKYFMPSFPRRPPSTIKVVKAFKNASNDIAKAKTEIRKVDNDNKIQEQKLKKTFSSQSKRISGNEYALAATMVVDKLKEEFADEFKKNEILNTALGVAPLIFQKPIKKELFKDPRLLGAGLTAVIAFIKDVRDRNKESEAVQSVTISPPVKTIQIGDSNGFNFTAVARNDKNNKIENKTFKWFTDNDLIASVDKDGRVTGVTVGNVKIFAQETRSDILTSVDVKVIAAPNNGS